ncbi:hypothetical protein GGR54DRAFT_634178 [Hypoxylon sp. NC1633]|nr:hypothetical protein GGR54DRAFT_634178 [Hypoxylon sp. NC1633]
MAEQPATKLTAGWDKPEFEYRPDDEYSSVLYACRELGRKLDICNETSDEVDRQISTDGKTNVIHEIQVEIKLPDSDVASLLKSSLDGLKFLTLTCTLVSAFDTCECARVLALLIQHHVELAEGQCPTSEQLLPLIIAIEARCQLSGFARHVVNYEIEILQELRAQNHETTSLCRLDKTPDGDAVVELVDLLLLLANGSREDCGISIYACRCVPWIAALVWWLYRKEPLVKLVSGEPRRLMAFNQPEAVVGITIVFQNHNDSSSPQTPEFIEIRALYSKEYREKSTFGLGPAKRYGGLVPINTYFHLMLSTFKLNKGKANEAAIKLIPYAPSAARKVTTSVEEAKTKARSTSASAPGSSCSTDWPNIASNGFEPFPSRDDIHRILHLVPGCEKKHMQDPRSKQMHMTLCEQAGADLFLRNEIYAADRAAWGKTELSAQFEDRDAPTEERLFLKQIAHVVATVLALSLFHDPEKLMEGCCDVTEWHRVCRMLAGERKEEEEEQEEQEQEESQKKGKGKQAEREKTMRDTIVSCYASQAVWPEITFKCEIPSGEESYLRLLWCWGHMYSRSSPNRRFTRVVGVDSRMDHVIIPKSLPEIATRLAPATTFTGQYQVEFRIKSHPTDERVLLCTMVAMIDGMQPSVCVDPSGVIKSLASAELLESCAHHPNASTDISAPLNIIAYSAAGTFNAEAVRPDVYLCSPEDPVPWLLDWAIRADDWDVLVVERGLWDLLCYARSLEKRPGTLAVVSVVGNDKVKFFTLAKPVGAHVAVRDRACVACCVEFCKKLQLSILVV